MNTPWGASQGRCHRIRRGVSFYTTAGHGGALVTRAAVRRLGIGPACLRGATQVTTAGFWYEEDCDIQVLLWELGDINPEKRRDHLESLRHYNPDYFEAKVLPGLMAEG